MATWKIAVVQFDCRLGENARNIEEMRRLLGVAADQRAKLVLFPECALSGYCYESKDEAWFFAETIPGAASDLLSADCRRLGVWTMFGLLERDGTELYNCAALLGPDGSVVTYRKLHLPFLGIDRFNTPGNRPLAVHDLGGLRVGMLICYDGSFPEAPRVLTLLGADLVVLPTNWPTGASSTVKVSEVRALENHIYYAAINRVGDERGFHFIGRSRIINPVGDVIAACETDQEAIAYAEVDPEWARQKRVVKIPGKYETDRIAHRRPEMYGVIGEPQMKPSGR